MISDLQLTNQKHLQKIEDFSNLLQKTKKRNQQEMEDYTKKHKQLQAEVDMAKEMVRSSKVQLKSKDTDIQRLNIKIKRLEKTNEIRE